MFYPYLVRLKVIDWSNPRFKIAESVGGMKITLPTYQYSHPELDGNEVKMKAGRTDLIDLTNATVCVWNHRLSAENVLSCPWFTLEEWVTLLDHADLFSFWTQEKQPSIPVKWGDPIIQTICFTVGYAEDFISKVKSLDDSCAEEGNIRGWYAWRHPGEEWISWVGPGVTVNHLCEVPSDVRMYDPRDLEMLL